MAGALEGVRVVDVTENLAGPFCTMILGDLGADVIKIERREVGDNIRGQGPKIDHFSLPFTMANRNKRSVTVNLKNERGKDVVRRLARRADVLVENYRPGTMDDLGLSYEQLCRVNPRLIYCSVSGFGQTGPYRERAGLDLIAQAMSGLMSVTGEPGGEPCKAGYPVTDLGTGMYAAIGVLGALHARHLTGRGQHVDCSLFETGVSWSVWHGAKYLGTGEIPGPQGSGHPLSVPYQAFKAKDMYVIVGAASQSLWRRLCRVLGLQDLATDARFDDQYKRVVHREELIPILQESFGQKDAATWLEALSAEGIPCAPVYTLDRTYSDPHTLARDMVVEVEHPVVGRVKTVFSPIKMSDTPPEIRLMAPVLGEHTDEVLRGLGYGDDEVATLRAEGAI